LPIKELEEREGKGKRDGGLIYVTAGLQLIGSGNSLGRIRLARCLELTGVDLETPEHLIN
jgi:hypothetical protein